MSNNKFIKVTTVFCIALAVVAGFACTLRATASRPLEDEVRVRRIARLPQRNDWHNLQFINQHEGWLANRKEVWRTGDGGKTWSLAFSGERSLHILDSISQLEFINSQTGWMLVSPGFIYTTDNAGVVWTRLNTPDIVVRSIHVLKDGKRAWIAGEMYRPISPRDAGVRSQLVSTDGKKVLYPALFHTEDGGISWAYQPLPSSEGRLLHLFSLDPDHVWASSDGEFFYFEGSSQKWKRVNYSKGTCPNRMLLKTTQWDSHEGDAYAPVAIYFSDTNQGWLSFENGYLAKSTDGGRSWCDLVDPRTVWSIPNWQTFFAKIHFTNSKDGWGLGGDGSLQETNDGGATWRNLNMNVQFEDLFFLDNKNGWVVSNDSLFRIIPEMNTVSNR